MAQVVEAVARGIDGFERRVAIKRLLPQHARDGERRRMFLEEARIGSRLHHGGIVPIFDYGLIDGSEFLAMEFVDGLDALRAVSGAADLVAMPEGIALHIAAEVGHALAYIHDLRDDQGRSLGIVHRDVSPPNILLSWDGDVKLSDFGIALSGWREERSVGGIVKGKLHYMAPEQALGQRVSAAADVYALGATLDALLGGQAMVPAMTDEETARRVEQARSRGVSPAVCALIGSCLARDPEQRPRAGDVAARAGALASRRLGRDGRGALRAWLQPLRPRTQKQSALDDLMGLCLVPVGPEGARTFTVSQVWQSQRADGSKRTPAPEVTPKKRSARGLIALAAVTAALLGWGGFQAVRRPVPVASPAPVHAAAPTPPPSTAPAVRIGTASSGGTQQIHVTARVPVASPDRPRSEEPLRPRHVLASSRHPAPPPAPAEAEGSSGASGEPPRGWLRVGGPNFAGDRITVDGAALGFAPLETSLAPGSHVIMVTEPTSGRVLLRKTLQLGEHHTRAAPLRILR
jgi:Protein kinase domain/PEGA domain